LYRGPEKFETTSCLLEQSYSICLCAFLAHVSGDTVPSNWGFCYEYQFVKFNKRWNHVGVSVNCNCC
jgi:hypothetical protein